MWKKNFLFRAHEAAPLKESENELFRDSEPALDSAGLQMEKFLSCGCKEGEDESPPCIPNLYVRTATLDFKTRAGFSNRCKGRTHQIKQMLTPEQKAFCASGCPRPHLKPGNESDDHFRTLFDLSDRF